MVKQSLTIVHLYPKEMNIYGDRGNVIALSYRAALRGVGTNILHCGLGDDIPKGVDIIVAGGGQDSGQLAVQADFTGKSKALHGMFNDGVVCLAVCGMYQLLGKEFITEDGIVIKGISYLDMYTEASDKRLIGNVIIQSDVGELVGFENHSGQTYLSSGQKPLGRVIKGFGNDETSLNEGIIYNNVFGTYLHGPILPKNPRLADELLRRALVRKYSNADIMNEHIDDSLELLAAKVAKTRP